MMLRERSAKPHAFSFTAPADGRYFVRLRDARGLQAESYRYQLTIQPPRPDYRINSATKELCRQSRLGW